MKLNGTREMAEKTAARDTSRRGSFRSGLLAVTLAAALGTIGLPAHAGVIGVPAGAPAKPSDKVASSKPRSSLQILKAQMNAAKGKLENLDKLKEFFEKDRPAREEIIRDAQQLIQTLPQNETAGDAAWRIAAIASLATSAGQLSSLRISDDYKLSDGAVGWDFGATGSPIQHGFTPVTPETLKLGGAEGNFESVNGATALTDGINAPAGFKTSLPNGMYRILIVADAAADNGDGQNPFGNGIKINGAPIGANDVAGTAPKTSRSLSGESGDKVAALDNTAVAKTAQGLGIEGWVIVRDGNLEIDFAGLPKNRLISAIVAEPIDLDKMELTPAIADALATAFSGLDPAAGPDSPRGGFSSRGGSAGTSQASGGASAGASGGSAGNGGAGRTAAPAPAARTAPAPTRRGPFINSFGNRRQQQVATAPAAPQDTPETVDAPLPLVQVPVQNNDTETPSDDFFERQILVKQGDGDDNSQGVAIDLGALLDNGSDTGTFLCDAAPCDTGDFTEISEEPDLSSAIDLLGDWLSDPANLEDWDDIAAVLENWAPGSEIALVYEFDITDDLWTDVEIRANAGDGILIWIDGVFIYGATGPGIFTDEAGYDYQADLPDLSNGSHVLQIIVSSNGGRTPAVTFEIRGNPANNTQTANATSVPEPGALVLFGLGLAGLVTIRRRKARA